MSAKRIRQVDIAREAEVSVATVDRVLNNRPGVNAHTAKRIHDAVARLEGHEAAPASPAMGTRTSLVFDFLLPGGPNSFMQMMHEAAERAGSIMAEQGVRTRVHRLEGFDPRALADAVRETAARSDGIALVAIENPIVHEAVNDAADRGIPLVTVVSNLASSRIAGYVGLNNRAAGRTAGYLMGRFLRKEPARIAILEGSLSLAYRDHQERDLGFRDALEEQFPQHEVIGRWATRDHFEESHRQCLEVLDRYPDLGGIYSIGAGVRGIADALTERGRQDQVVFIGHDLTRHSRQFLIDGVMDTVLHQGPETQALAAVKLLLAHHRGTASPTPERPRIEVYFRENLP